MKGERRVAGLRCAEVIARLSDYVDGELSPEALAQVRAHVAGCDVCERFGGEFSSVVRALKSVPVPELDPAIAERLAKAIEIE